MRFWMILSSVLLLGIEMSAQLVDGMSEYESLIEKYNTHLADKNRSAVVKAGLDLWNAANKIDSAEVRTDAAVYLCYAYIYDKQFGEAVAVAEKAVELASSVLDTANQSFSGLLSNYSFALRKSSRFLESITVGHRLLHLDTILNESESASHFVHLHNLSSSYHDASDYSKSLHYSKLAERGTRQHLGTDHASYVGRLNSLALSHKRLGDFENALASYREAARIAKSTKGEMHPDIGLIFSNITGLYLEQDQFVEAKAAINVAIENALQNGGENSNYFRRVHKLAVIEERLGNYQEALSLNYLVFDHYSLNDPKDDNLAISSSSLAKIYSQLGQHERAILHQTIACDQTIEKYGGQHIYSSIELNNLGQIESTAGELDSAVVHLTRALEIESMNRGDSHWRYGLYLHNLSAVYVRLNDFETALAFSDQSLAHTERKLGRDHTSYATRLMMRASIQQKLQHDQEPLDLYEEALVTFEARFGPNHMETLNAQISLAKFREARGETDLAQSRYKLVIDALQHQFDDIYPTLSDRERISFWEETSPKLNNLMGFAFQHGNKYPDLVNRIYNLHHATKGFSLKLNMIQNQYKNQSSDDRKLMDSLRDYKVLLASGFHSKEDEEEINRKIIDLESRISTKLAGALAKSGAEEEFRQIQKRLLPGELVVDLLKIKRNALGQTESLDGYFAFTFDAQSQQPTLLQLSSNQNIEQELSTLQSEHAPIAQVLSEHFFDYLHDLSLGEIQTIYVSPSGDYHYLPYCAASVLLDSISDIDVEVVFDLSRIGDTRNLSYSELAIFGNPDFDLHLELQQDDLALNLRSTGEGLRGSKYFSPLPGTKHEIETVAELFSKTSSQVQVYEEALATEDNFRLLDGHSPEIIHIATHGFSFDQYQGEDLEVTNLRERSIVSENPMFRSGLALAGANRTWLEGTGWTSREDGILTAFEIALMDLSQCKLLVLSACESGQGEASEQEGVFGMHRAFKKAGVEQMLISLWKIPDKETAELMQLFYSELCSGQEMVEALKTAQTKMSETYSPFFWAGFVLVQ